MESRTYRRDPRKGFGAVGQLVGSPVNEIVNALLPGSLLPTSRKGHRADAAGNSISAEDLVTLS